MPKLNKRFVSSIKAEDKELVLWDTELPCFGLRIKPSGRKTFIVQYRNETGRSRRLTLGTYGKLTPDEARKMARQMLSDSARGEDVAETRTAKRKGLTMADLTERYKTEHAAVKKKPSSTRNDKQMIRDYILPSFGRYNVEAITRKDIARIHHELREKPTTANRLLSLLSKMFNLAEKWGLRPDGTNPCRHIEKYQECKRKRYLSGEELARLGKALTESEESELPSATLALRLLLFTGCRLSEILTLKWEHVDLEAGVLRLPDIKTGAKVVPLPGPAQDLLINTPRVNLYVCFGQKPDGHLVGIHKIWQRIRAQAGLEDIRLHDLRHSFASVAAANNMGLPIIGALLGHSQPATTQRYAHLSIDPLKAASDEIAKKIDTALKKEPKRAKVIKLIR